jgi:hypothetical protein
MDNWLDGVLLGCCSATHWITGFLHKGPFSDSIYSAEIEVMIYAQCAVKRDLFYQLAITLSIHGYTDALAMGYPICRALSKNLFQSTSVCSRE